MGAGGLPDHLRREGVWLAVAVMALDLVANAITNWPHVWRLTLIAVVTVFVLVTALPLLRGYQLAVGLATFARNSGSPVAVAVTSIR
jgi:hypothetical protein